MTTPTLLLHGALGSAGQFTLLKERLSYQEVPVHTLSFAGHGLLNEDIAVFSIPLFARQVISYLDANNLATVNIFGYSMGGYVALYVARHYPKRIQKIMTLATKFHWTPEIAVGETKMLNPDLIEHKVPEFAQQLKKLHGEQHWKTLLKKTADMMISLGHAPALQTEDFTKIEQAVLIGLGDSDKMVSLEESMNVYKSLKNSGFYMMPHTKHPIESVDTKRLAFEIASFMQ